MTSEATAAKDAASAPTTFSLKPQHMDDPGLMLVFRYTKAGGMQLVPNAFSARMSREVDTFIQKFKCIPAFTANLTIENFQKQTQC
jgi:mitotic spindle assembly checkpoint protein MAD1